MWEVDQEKKEKRDSEVLCGQTDRWSDIAC